MKTVYKQNLCFKNMKNLCINRTLLLPIQLIHILEGEERKHPKVSKYSISSSSIHFEVLLPYFAEFFFFFPFIWKHYSDEPQR